MRNSRDTSKKVFVFNLTNACQIPITTMNSSTSNFLQPYKKYTHKSVLYCMHLIEKMMCNPYIFVWDGSISMKRLTAGRNLDITLCELNRYRVKKKTPCDHKMLGMIFFYSYFITCTVQKDRHLCICMSRTNNLA